MPRSSFEASALRWVPGEGPVEVFALGSGLMNDTCRVARAGRVFSLRLGGVDRQELGLDRNWECRVLAAAAAAGVAPTIELCEPVAGVLVAEWVDGRVWTPAEVHLPGPIRRMAQLLRAVHALHVPEPARVMTPAAWIAYYGELAARCDVPRPPHAAALQGAAHAHVARLNALGPIAPVICHGDVHRLNVIVSRSVMLLDWEYAHVSDPFWDLAGWIANNDWSTADASTAARGVLFLREYLERPARPEEESRLALNGWLYDYVCLLWSELYLMRSASAPVSARSERLLARLSAG